ncbi:hypothetical protein PVAND_008403 [Polypedilum vanderplanki]|uniref:Uncharacterized protein n=1 Tax=Polypedilum vanderplanki TaxID=319348 RepID=A0A9J6C9W0_POLVA|nr:hypothetical protein PVAND_008403 [Polypedilum vanderplanki]
MAEKEDELETFCRSIREIPFRILANKYSLEEKDFVKGVYNTKIYSNFFLTGECQRQFQNKIAHHIEFDPRAIEIRKMKRQRKSKPFKSNETYSDVLANRTVSYQRKMNEKDDDNKMQIYTTEYLESISPSALSKDFIEYSTIDFDVIAPKNEIYGEAFETIVEVFLNTIVVDELLMCLMIVFNEGNNPLFLQDKVHELRVYKCFIDKNEETSYSLSSLATPAINTSSSSSSRTSYEADISHISLSPEAIAYYSAFPELTFSKKSDN